MKISLLLPLLLLPFAHGIGQTIVATRGYALNDLSFPTPEVGYAVGADSVLKTTDGGSSWRTLPFGAGGKLRAVDFQSERTGWVAGDSSTLYRTDDGGDHWRRLDPGVTADLRDVRFITPATGFLVGTRGTMRRTDDGGNHWSSIIQTGEFDLNAIAFPTPDIGHIAGQFAHYITTNGGASWRAIDSSLATWTTAMKFPTPDLGFVRTASFVDYLQRTTDGGHTWDTIHIYDAVVDFRNSRLGFLVSDFLALRSTDGGTTWGDTLIHGMDTLHPGAVHFINDSVGFVVGFKQFFRKDGRIEEGRIVRITAGKAAGVTVEREIDGVRIHADGRMLIVEPAAAEIRVIDMLGREIITRSTAPGTREVINLPDGSLGVCLVEISSGTERTVRKVIVR